MEAHSDGAQHAVFPDDWYQAVCSGHKSHEEWASNEVFRAEAL